MPYSLCLLPAVRLLGDVLPDWGSVFDPAGGFAGAGGEFGVDSERLVTAAHGQHGGFGGEPGRLCFGTDDGCGFAAVAKVGVRRDRDLMDARLFTRMRCSGLGAWSFW